MKSWLKPVGLTIGIVYFHETRGVLVFVVWLIEGLGAAAALKCQGVLRSYDVHQLIRVE